MNMVKFADGDEPIAVALRSAVEWAERLWRDCDRSAITITVLVWRGGVQ